MEPSSGGGELVIVTRGPQHSDRVAFQQWLRDGGLTPKPGQAKEVFAKEARI